MSKPLIFGHRGAPAALPENTLAGFQHAIDVGADGIELDVFLTRDGVPVVTHNAHLLADTTRGPDGNWLEGEGPSIADLTLEELQRFDVGSCHPDGPHAKKHPHQDRLGFTAVPTLAAVLELIADHPVEILVELKHTPDDALCAKDFVAKIAALVAQHGLIEKSYVHAFNWQILSAAAEIAPDWRRSYLSCSPAIYPDGSLYRGSPWLDGLPHEPATLLPALAARGAALWCPHYKDLDAESLRIAHDNGLRVMTWTVNDTAAITADIQRGVDGIVTDDPKTALAL